MGWILPVEKEFVDGVSDYYITFPDDLLEEIGLKAGDSIEWIDNHDGSFTLKKTPDAEILWLISTGTGLAPYIAMLRCDEAWERYRRIIVVHGVIILRC